MTPELLSLLVWLPFLCLAAIFGTVFAILGFKRGSAKAGISVGVTALSAALSVLLARAIASATASASSLLPMIAELMGGDLPEGEHFAALIEGCATAVGALALFIPCFLLLLLLLKNLTSLVFTARIPKAKHVGNKLGGMAIGLVDALLVSFLLLLPIYGTLNMGGNLLSAVPILADGENASIGEAAESLDALCRHPFSKMAGLPPFNTAYDSMAAFTHDGETVSVSKTVNTVSGVVTAAVSYKNGEAGASGAMLKAIDHLETVVTESRFFAGLLCDVAAEGLDGVELIDNYAGFSDKAILQQDMKAVFALTRSAIQNDVVPAFFEKELDLSAMELGTLPYDMAEALNATESLAALKASLIDSAIDALLTEAAGGDEAKLAELRAVIGKTDPAPLTGEPVKAEGDALYVLLSSAIKATDEKNTATTAAVGELAGNLIEGLARHPAFGSDKVMAIADVLLGLSEEGGEAGAAAKDAFKDVLDASLTKPVKEATFGKFVGTATATADTIAKLQNGEADAASMESILDATPEVLEQMETVVNDELLEALGIGEEQSAAVTPLVNTLFTAIRETELTSEEKTVEAEALSGALACVFTLDQSDDVLDVVNELVDCYLDSKLLGSVAEQLTEEKEDPFDLALSSQDKNAIGDLLKETIAEASSEEAAEKIDHLAALLGVELN